MVEDTNKRSFESMEKTEIVQVLQPSAGQPKIPFKYIQPGSVAFFEDKFPDIPPYCHEYLSIKTQKGEDAAQHFLNTLDKPGIISNVPQEDGTTKPVLVNW